MKFVAIADTHCRHKNLKLPKGDVLIHAGDISYKGEKAEVVDFLSWFKSQPHPHKIFIAGNHDFFFEKAKPSEVAALIPDGVTYLKDSGTTVNGIRIWGSPVTPWFYNWAFNQVRGASIRRHWNMISGDTDILVTHGPVFGILDTVINGKNVGCRDLLNRVQEIRPRVHICGHIHEGYGLTLKNGIRYINASVLNESYELVNRPVVFDLEPRLVENPIS